MIKVFRNLRRRLWSEGKFNRYLPYAVGEIILVVIGILIALQINNWNEARKNRVEEADYYCKLLDDFELDRINIDLLSKASDYKIETSKRLLLELEALNKDKSYLIDTYIQALRTNTFVPSKVAFTDIVSSGKLNLISDDLLKNSLVRYYSELDKYLYQLEINRSNIINRAFAYDDEIRLGYQFADYAKISLGEQIVNMLPVDNWHLDKGSDYYRQFQNDLVFFVLMSEREKQHFRAISEAMEKPYTLLKKACSNP